VSPDNGQAAVARYHTPNQFDREGGKKTVTKKKLKAYRRVHKYEKEGTGQS